MKRNVLFMVCALVLGIGFMACPTSTGGGGGDVGATPTVSSPSTKGGLTIMRPVLDEEGKVVIKYIQHGSGSVLIYDSSMPPTSKELVELDSKIREAVGTPKSDGMDNDTKEAFYSYTLTAVEDGKTFTKSGSFLVVLNGVATKHLTVTNFTNGTATIYLDSMTPSTSLQ